MVLTKDLSRLGRDYILTGYYLEKFFPENGVRYIALLDGIDTGSESSINDITPFRAVFNDMYAKDISLKIKSVKHNKQSLGLFIGGKAPLGYKLNKKIPNKLFIDEEAKPIIQRIFSDAMYGLSCHNIAIKLTLDGVPTPSQYAINHGQKVAKYSTSWSDTKVREIIQNEVYIGNMVQGRMKKISYKSKKNIRLPKKEWKIVKNTHEPIIDCETFQKANEMITSRKQTRIKSHDYILKGLVYCHECGKKMYCSSRHLASGIKYYFRCKTHISKTNSEYCSPHSLRMDYVQNLIISIVNKFIYDYFDEKIFHELIIKYVEKNYNSFNYAEKLKQYELEISALSEQIDKLYEDKLSGIIQDDDFQRIYKSKKITQSKLSNDLSKLKKSNFSNIKQIEQILTEKFKYNLNINRKILTDFVQKIELDKSKKIYVYLKFRPI